MIFSLILFLLQAFQPRFVSEKTLSQSSDTLISQAWTVEEGLPVNTVNSIVQDKKGYIWFTTYDGIVRFDGINFQIFNHSNTPELPQNRAVFVYYQQERGIWITLENGGVVLIDDEENFKHFDETEGFTSGNTTSMMEDSKGRMWFSTFNGLYKFDEGVFTRMVVRDTPEKNRISFTYEDFDGTIWVATHDGLLQITDNNDYQVYNVAPGKAQNEFRRIQRFNSEELLVSALEGLYLMGDDGLYIPEKFEPFKNTAVPYLYRDDQIALISTDIGLYEYNGTAKLLYTHRRSNAYFWYFFRDSQETLWMISTHGEIIQLKNDEILKLKDTGHLPPYYYNNLLEDRENNIWLATARNGILRVKKSQVRSIGNEEGLSGNNILGLFEDSRGRFWVGTRDFGLNVIDGNKITQYREADLLHRDIVHSINEDYDGNIWVGYYQGGIDRFSDEEITSFNLGFGAGVNDIRSVFVHSDSTIWLGTYGGLVKFDPDHQHHRVYTEKDGLAGNLVRYMDEDEEGGLWIGTMSGVSHFKDGTFTNYTSEKGLASNIIRSVYADEYDPGTIWVGTETNGLSRIRGNEIHSVGTKEGLPDHVIHYISQDHLGWLWMSSNRGIFKIDKKDLNNYLDGKSDYFNLIHFGRAEGMRNPEANGTFQQGGLRTSENTFWFATQAGVAVFEIEPQQTNDVPPTVLIESFWSNGQSYSPDNLDFEAGTKAFQVNFQALTYVSPEKTRFRYLLEGYENDWNEVINERTANYSFIPPGEYTFKVTAANNDGIWNEEPVAVSFELLPVFYQQAWFYILLAVLLIGGYYPASRIRYNYLLKQQEKLKKVIEEQTAELRKEKSEIEEQSKIIKHQAEKLEESNKTKDKFFSLIAHDLRNPFQAILGYSQLTLSSVEDLDRSTIKRNLEYIHISSKSLLTLVEHLLNWASLHTGKIIPDPERINLKELIERILQLFEHVAEQKEIELKSKAEDNLFITADLNMLETILRNLVSNAIKFTQKGGYVLVDVVKKGRHYIIEIEDNGIGMSQKLIDRLLRLDANTSRVGTNKEKGSGLGLLICKEMVHLHNGEITVESKEGIGTKFIIKLPAKGLPETIETSEN